MMQSTESTSALNDEITADNGDDEEEPQKPPTSSAVLSMLEQDYLWSRLVEMFR